MLHKLELHQGIYNFPHAKLIPFIGSYSSYKVSQYYVPYLPVFADSCCLAVWSVHGNSCAGLLCTSSGCHATISATLGKVLFKVTI